MLSGYQFAVDGMGAKRTTTHAPHFDIACQYANEGT